MSTDSNRPKMKCKLSVTIIEERINFDNQTRIADSLRSLENKVEPGQSHRAPVHSSALLPPAEATARPTKAFVPMGRFPEANHWYMASFGVYSNHLVRALQPLI